MPLQIVPVAHKRSHHFNTLLALQAPQQQLTAHGGPVLASVKIKAVFWGDPWTQDPTLSGMIPRFDSFLTWFVSSPTVTSLSEYNTNGQVIGAGTYDGSEKVAGAVNQQINDTDVRTMLSGLWQNDPLGSDGLWIAFTPPNVQVTAGNDKSCRDFCGYHWNAGNTAYAVIPYPCSDCEASANPALSAFDCITCALSHEICEAITDPFGTGWYVDAANNPEIGDLCAVPKWQVKTVNGYTVQREWSNASSSCA